MAKQRLEIGTTEDGKPLTLPATDTETQTITVFGGRGMGKTNLGSVLCEELADAGRRFCFLDPMGVAWGMRHSASGKGEGLKILILGGRHGDLPIEPTGGAVIADFIAGSRENVLIDISSTHDGRRWSQGAKIKFAADYFERLLEVQGEHRRPLMQIVDEAARFAPQTIEFKRDKDDPVSRCKVALEVLLEEGRNAGVGVTLLTQRSARIAKSVTELAELMIAFRIIGPNSTQAVLDWFGAHVAKQRHNELLERLRQLPRGEALVVSPGWLAFEGVAQIRLRHTFDSSKTPTGTETKLAKRVRPRDLDKLRELIAGTVEKAEADDPSKLRKALERDRRQLADLRRELDQVQQRLESERAKPKALKRDEAKGTRVNELKGELTKYRHALEAAMKILVKVRAVDFAVETDDGRKALEQAVAAAVKQVTAPIEKRVATLVDRVEGIKKTAAAAEHAIAALLDEKIDLTVTVQKSEPFTVAVPPPARRARRAKDDDQPVEGLTEPQRRILDIVAMLHQRGITPNRECVAAWLDLHPRGGNYGQNIGALRAGGYLEDWMVTDKGAATARELPTGVDAAMEPLTEPQRRILQLVINSNGTSYNRESAAEALGLHPRGGSYGENIGRLRTMGLLEPRGDFKTTEALFR